MSYGGHFFPFAIATGCWKSSVHLKLYTAGFDVTNPAVASSDDSYHREEIMAIAYERAKDYCGAQQFKTIIYVGDGIWDLMESRTMGYHFMDVASGNRGTV